MGKKKEAKPLLDKTKQQQQMKTGISSTTTASTSSVKKLGKNKGVTTTTSTLTTSSKQNLNNVRDDSSSESDDIKNSNTTTPTTEKPSTPTLQTVPETELLVSTQSIQEGGEDIGTTGIVGTTTTDETKSCPMSYFGVKSYIHHFYENANQTNTSGYEEDYHYLIRPKGKQIGAYLFKVGLIIGSTLFLMGAVAIIIGYAIPKHVEIKQQTDEIRLMDRNAIRFNRNLDICKLIGLAGFCCGGLILVISLLAPTFTSSYWDVEALDEPFRVPINTPPVQEDEPKSPIPVTEKIKCIQPSWAE